MKRDVLDDKALLREMRATANRAAIRAALRAIRRFKAVASGCSTLLCDSNIDILLKEPPDIIDRYYFLQRVLYNYTIN